MIHDQWKLDIGAYPIGAGEWKFRLWAPFASKVDLVLSKGKDKVSFDLTREPTGYYSGIETSVEGTKYAYVIDKEKRRGDPASRYQPDGINGDSCLVDPSKYSWSDSSWKGVPLSDLIIYELHVGTFTKEGTFESLIPFLHYLGNELGVTAIEIMPVAQFPGNRNWGYDGVMMYAVQNTYGGPLGLKKLVDSCHSAGLGVVLDVVYNHLGPEGNHLSDFGPYFSNKYRTPWGPSINYDSGGSDEVRRYVVNNALYWITEYHIDGLRLDAIHGIFDSSPTHILQEMNQEVERWKPEGKLVHLIAESDLNDPKITRPKKSCGYGLSAQWSDDFHHSIHAFLTGEKNGYYVDFGGISDISKVFSHGFVYDGKYSKFRNRTHGAPSSDVPGNKFVVCIQNHDQVGNRPDGARLSVLVSKAALKVAAALNLLSPYLPMLFMGEEYGETAPFHFFTSHIDPEIASATRQGRKREFTSHNFKLDFIDPQAETTFEKSKLNLGLRYAETNEELFGFYRELIGLRKSHAALRNFERRDVKVDLLEDQKVLITKRKASDESLIIVFVLNERPVDLKGVIGKSWTKLYASERTADNTGVLPPMSLAIYSDMG